VDQAESGTPDGTDDKTVKTEKLQARTSDLCLLCGALRPAEGHICDGSAATDNSAQISTANWIGVIVGTHYQILSLIGRGGMSTVFKARHQLLKKMVALKILTPQFRVDQQKLLRFQQEAISVGRLDHPNIIKIYEFAVPEDREPYLVMDYVEGTTLADEIARSPLPLSRALNIFKQICLGLSHAHKMGVIHRDLKPSNVMIASDSSTGNDTPSIEKIEKIKKIENIKIVDFGIAKVLTPELSAVKLTQTGEIFGSPLYMSPEQCMGKSPDARSDIYSLGCLIFETLTGKPPFEGPSVLETIHLHLYGVPPLTTSYTPSLEHSEAINTMILRCLAKNPDDRYQSMDAVLYALERLDGSARENFLQRIFLSWQMRNLLRNAAHHGNWPAQIGISIIAVTVLTTAFAIWEQSSVTVTTSSPTRKPLVDSSIQSADTETQKQFLSTMILGQKEFDDGRLDAARKLFLDFVGQSMSPEEANLLKAQVYAQLTDLEYVAGQVEQSNQYLEKARAFQGAAVVAPFTSALAQLKELEAPKKIDDDIFDNLNDEARICEELQAMSKAKMILERTLVHATKFLPPDSAHIARTEKNLAHVYFILGDFKQAHEYYAKSLQIRLLKPGFYQLDAIMTLKDAAELDITMGNFEEAHKFLDHGIQLMHSNANLNNWIMADLHVLRAKVFEHSGARDSVISELREAQSIYSMIPLQNDVYQEKADFLVQWANSLLQSDSKDKEAVVALENAVHLYEQAPLKRNIEFVAALTRLAQVYREQGNLLPADRLAWANSLDKRAQAITRRIDSQARAL
jgi:serine/threonine protein kinase